MVPSLRRISWYICTLIFFDVAMSGPGMAMAQNADLSEAWYQSSWIAIILGMLGSIYAGFVAYSTFESQTVDMGGIPVLPKYLTRKPLYVSGLAAYVGFSVIIFVALSLYYKDLYPFIKYIVPSAINDLIEPRAGKPTLPVVALIIGGVLYIAVLQWRSGYNPVTVIRRGIMRWASIPTATNVIRNEIIHGLTVPKDWRVRLTSTEKARFVELKHFEQRQGSPERCWAEISYLRAWILSQQSECNRPGFFQDNEVKFDEIVNDPGGRYAQALDLANALFTQSKRGGEVEKKLREVHECLAWLVGCFLVYSNSKKVSLIRAARSLGIVFPDDLVALPPVGTILVFLVAISATAVFSTGGAAALYDLSQGEEFGGGVIGDILGPWTLATVLLYVFPVVVVILVRYLSELVDRWTLRPHIEFYAFAGLMGFGLSLAAVIALAKYRHPALATKDMWTLIGSLWIWSLAPAVATALVAVRMDPFPAAEKWRKGYRNVLVSVGFALALCLIVLWVMTIHPVAAETWTPEKTRAVGSAVAFAIGLALGLLAGKGGQTFNFSEPEIPADLRSGVSRSSRLVLPQGSRR